jgi:hypothetical protein
VLRRIFGSRRNEVTGDWKNYVMRSIIICTPKSIPVGQGM